MRKCLNHFLQYSILPTYIMLTKTYTLTHLATVLFSLSGLLLSVSVSALAPLDSIGITTINNQQFVLHRVDAGETLGTLATRYRTTEASIKQANNGLAQGIQANQIVMIPFVPDVPKVTHTVQPKETLYGIAKMYGMTIAELKQLNSIATDGVQVGQTLTVKTQAAVATNPANTVATQPPPSNPPITNAYNAAAPNAPATNLPAVDTAPTNSVPATTPAKPLGPIVRKTPKNYMVQPKETLYGLAKLFSVPVDSLVIWNNNQNGFKVGQIIISGYNYYDANSNLILSSGYPAASTAATNPQSAPASTTNQPGADPYNQPAATAPAQQPAVDPYNQPAASAPAQQPAIDPYNQPAAVNQPAADPYNQPAATVPAQQPAGQLPTAAALNQPAAQAPATTAPATQPVLAAQQPNGVASSFGQVPSYHREDGVGAMIKANSNSDNPNVFVALHRTAPYGTMIKVTNPSSNTSTVVKVIGTISSEIPADKNIIIKLSIATCRQLGILTEQFPIVIEYSK